jgi:chromosome partitioning protein
MLRGGRYVRTMGQIIACGNLKGGVGRTTLAVNLACALATRGHDVGLLDLDAQGSAAAWAAAGRLPVPVEAVPSVEGPGKARWPARAGELAGGGRLVVLDLPPLLLPTLASALIIADVVLVPLTPSALDVAATRQTLRMIRMTRESRPGRKPKALLVPNRVESQRGDQLGTEAALSEIAERRAPAIRQRAEYAEAFAMGDWIGRHAPASPATLDILALADALEGALEIERRVQVEAAAVARATV